MPESPRAEAARKPAPPRADAAQTYFVTGATGFLGGHLVARLLARGGTVHALVRPGSEGKLTSLAAARQAGPGRLVPVSGDLTLPLLGVSDEQHEALSGAVGHFVHCAACYDLAADEAQLRAANVDGTRHALALAAALGTALFHHVSSVAVAGDFVGDFDEEMLDAGQGFPHPYHRTKFEAEQLVRASAPAWRVYRPSVIVGDSRTGEIDKVDGPYLLFQAIARTRSLLPPWVPLVGPELGDTNLVPVDFVAGAIDFLAHRDGLDGRAFHLVDHRRQPVSEVLNVFARAAHAPQLALRIDPRLADGLPRRLLARAAKLPGVTEVYHQLLRDFGIPAALLPHLALAPRLESGTTRRELRGADMEMAPPLETYAWRLWDFWERQLAPAPPDGTLPGAVSGRRVLITGASSGIGRATAIALAAAGATVLLVARSDDKLRAVQAEIERDGGAAHVYVCDLSDAVAIDGLVARVQADHASIDVLVNNAGRSIRRSVELSYERFHDFERTVQLNYLGAVKLTLGLLPDMRRRGHGHVVNVSSIGVQVGPPRFSAYVASKAALDAWTRVVAAETVADGVSFTTVHMPLVRTPMIAPTRLYDAFPAITPRAAAELICRAIQERPKHIGTRLGAFGELAHTVAPKAMDHFQHAAYRIFPDSTAARGDGEPETPPSREAVTLARLLRGIHW